MEETEEKRRETHKTPTFKESHQHGKKTIFLQNGHAFYSGYKNNSWPPFVILVIFNIIIWSAYRFLNALFEEVFIFSMFSL